MNGLPEADHPPGTTTASALPETAISRVGQLQFFGSLVAALLVVLSAGLLLWQARQDSWRLSERASENLLHGVMGFMEQHFRIFALELDQFVERAREPEIAALSPQAKAYALASFAKSMDFVANVLVLDASGNAMLASQPDVSTSTSLADRDYFRTQRDNPDAGLL